MSHPTANTCNKSAHFVKLKCTVFAEAPTAIDTNANYGPIAISKSHLCLLPDPSYREGLHGSFRLEQNSHALLVVDAVNDVHATANYGSIAL